MIRRPRYPLTLRLAWIEQELESAARLLPMMAADMKAMRRSTGDAYAKVILVAHLAVTVLLPFGADPVRMNAFIAALGAGDLEEADRIAGDIVGEVLIRMLDTGEEEH